MANFDKAYSRTAVLEGGYNPNDKGSVSVFGIRRKNNPSWDGWAKFDSLKNSGMDDTKIQKAIMSDEALKKSAKSYFKANYWDSMKLNAVKDDDVAFEIFDHGVNAGIGTSAKIVNKSFGIGNSSSMSPSSISIINSNGKDAKKRIQSSRTEYYKSLGDENNISGWLKRIGFGSSQQEELNYEQQLSDSTESVYEQRRALRDSSWQDKITSFGLNAAINSTTNDIVKYFDRSNVLGYKDSSWMKQMEDSSMVDSLIQKHGLDSIYFSDIKKSESKGHFDRILNSIKEEEAQRDYISMKLGTTGLVSSGLVGGLVMSPENILLPVAIPLRATRAILIANESLSLINSANATVRASRSLSPFVQSLSPSSVFHTSAVAAQEIAFANKANGIRKAAMLQGASLAVLTPNIKYAVNKDYTQTDFLFDLVTYGAIDTGFINHAAKSSTADILNSASGIVDRVNAHYKSLSASSGEYKKASDEIIREQTVSKSVDRIRAKQAELRANIEKNTQELLLKSEKEKQSALDEIALREKRVQESVERLKDSGRKLSKNIKEETQKLIDEDNDEITRLKNIASEKEAIIKQSVERIKEASSKAKQSSIDYATKVNVVKKNIDNLKVYMNTLVDDVKNAMLAYQSNGSTENFYRLQEAQANVAKVENDINILSDSLKSESTKALDDALEEVVNRINNTTKGSNANISKSDIDDAKELISNVDNTFKTKEDAIKAIDEAGLSDLVKEDGTTDAKVSIDKDGSFTIGSGKTKMSLPKKAALALIALEGLTFADSGDGINAIEISGLATLAILLGGSFYLKGLREGTKGVGTAKSIADSLKAKLSSGVSSGNVGKILENTAELLAGAWSETAKPLIESTTEFISSTTGKNMSVKDIARILIRDQRNLGAQVVESAEDLSANFVATNKYDFVTKETESLTNAYKEVKSTMSLKERATNILFENEFMVSIRREATRLVENPSMSGNKYAKEIANSFSNSMARMLKIAQDLNIDGAKGLSNFVPRYWKSDDAYHIILQNKDAYDKIYQNLVDGFVSAGNNIEKSKSLAKYRMDKLTVRMSGNRVDVKKIEEDEISDRFKDRDAFDKNAWKPFEATVDGRVINVEMSHIIEDDLAVIFDRYVHEMSGHVALAQHGFTNYSKFYQMLDEIPNSSERNTLIELTDIIFGKEVVDHTSTGYKIAQSSKNIATSVLLPLGGINMAGELYKLAFKTSGKKSGFLYMANRLMDTTIASGDDSSWFDMMRNFHGAGMDARIGSLTHRGFAETNMVGGTASANAMDDILQLTSRTRDFTMTFSQLPRLTDFARSVSLELNMDLLARYLNGKQNIHPLDLESWGITERTSLLLKDALPLNSSGYMKKIDPSSFTPSQQAEFKKIIRNMGMTDIQMHTLGGTAQYTRTSALGIALSGLMGFAMQSYVTHGIRDIKGISQGRPESFISTALWLAGGMTTYYIKSMIQGKDYDEEDAFAYAGTMLPMASPLSLKNMITEPAAFSAIDTMLMSPYENIKTAKGLLDNE